MLLDRGASALQVDAAGPGALLLYDAPDVMAALANQVALLESYHRDRKSAIIPSEQVEQLLLSGAAITARVGRVGGLLGSGAHGMVVRSYSKVDEKREVRLQVVAGA